MIDLRAADDIADAVIDQVWARTAGDGYSLFHKGPKAAQSNLSALIVGHSALAVCAADIHTQSKRSDARRGSKTKRLLPPLQLSKEPIKGSYDDSRTLD